jgi:hypothetical protein
MISARSTSGATQSADQVRPQRVPEPCPAGRRDREGCRRTGRLVHNSLPRCVEPCLGSGTGRQVRAEPPRQPPGHADFRPVRNTDSAHAVNIEYMIVTVYPPCFPPKRSRSCRGRFRRGRKPASGQAVRAPDTAHNESPGHGHPRRVPAARTRAHPDRQGPPGAQTTCVITASPRRGLPSATRGTDEACATRTRPADWAGVGPARMRLADWAGVGSGQGRGCRSGFGQSGWLSRAGGSCPA